VRGALRSLGVEGPITSPTFVVGHLHEGRGRPLAHLDLYRLAGMGGEDPGLLDPFFAEDTIVFVEWPEHAEGAWPRERVSHRVRLAHAGGDGRRVEVDP
jgi:tRNA threonylcarbamoyladenosine biosynthesis protein TsaE